MRETGKQNNLKLAIVAVILIALLAVGAFAVSNYRGEGASGIDNEIGQDDVVQVPNEEFVNGVYSVVGNYVSPGGPRHINVELTLEDGVIVDANVEPTATDPTSKEKQEDFTAHYKEQVIGRSISGLSIDKVSGSSLTPKGFNDALKKVRDEARV